MTRHTVGAHRSTGVVGALSLVMALCMLVFVSVAQAAEGPQWRITATTEPTHVVPGSTEARLTITAINVGGVATSGAVESPTRSARV